MILLLLQTSASQWLENKYSSNDSGDKALRLGMRLGDRDEVLILSPCPGHRSSLSVGAIVGITVGILAIVALAIGLGCFIHTGNAEG